MFIILIACSRMVRCLLLILRILYFLSLFIPSFPPSFLPSFLPTFLSCATERLSVMIHSTRYRLNGISLLLAHLLPIAQVKHRTGQCHPSQLHGLRNFQLLQLQQKVDKYLIQTFMKEHPSFVASLPTK